MKQSGKNKNDKTQQHILDRDSRHLAVCGTTTSLVLCDRVKCGLSRIPFTTGSLEPEGDWLVFGDGSPELNPESRHVLAGKRKKAIYFLNFKITNYFYNCIKLPLWLRERERERERERDRNVLFNDALNTFYLRLYGIRHMVKDHSDSAKGNPLPPHRLLLSINSKGSFICTIPQAG